MGGDLISELANSYRVRGLSVEEWKAEMGAMAYDHAEHRERLERLAERLAGVVDLDAATEGSIVALNAAPSYRAYGDVVTALRQLDLLEQAYSEQATRGIPVYAQQLHIREDGTVGVRGGS